MRLAEKDRLEAADLEWQQVLLFAISVFSIPVQRLMQENYVANKVTKTEMKAKAKNDLLELLKWESLLTDSKISFALSSIQSAKLSLLVSLFVIWHEYLKLCLA